VVGVLYSFVSPAVAFGYLVMGMAAALVLLDRAARSDTRRRVTS
jgi:hypothetical protein